MVFLPGNTANPPARAKAPKKPKAPRTLTPGLSGSAIAGAKATVKRSTGKTSVSPSPSPSTSTSVTASPTPRSASTTRTSTVSRTAYRPDPIEDRQPSPVGLDRESLIKQAARRISRRGGYGLYNARMPIDTTMDDLQGDFGPRVHPKHGGYSNHTGVDISRAGGTPIVASVGGTVSKAAQDNIYGNQVVVDHGAGEETMYGHMSQYVVKPGEKIKKGQVIGYVGNTGLSTGNHLHWETWKDGQPLDPSTVFGRDIPQDIINEAMKKMGRVKPPQGGPPAPSPTPPPVPIASGGEMGSREPFRNNAFALVDNVSTGPEAARGNTQQAAIPIPPQQVGQVAAASIQAASSPVGNQAQPLKQPKAPGKFDAFMQAISQQESGDNYGAVGIPTKYGTALGKYQILDANLSGEGGWDMEALGQEITGQQFLNSPAIQDQIAKFKLREYFQTYGPEGAAKAWYAGPGNANLDSNNPQPGGMPSVNSYSDSILEIMQKYLQGE